MVDSAFLDKEYGDKITRRIEDFDKAIALYSKGFHISNPKRVLTVKGNVARTLAYLYFHWCYINVKPNVKNLADRYKVASNTEFCVTYIQPFSIEDGSSQENASVNAMFGFYLAVNIIKNFADSDDDSFPNYKEEILTIQGGVPILEERIDKIITNHKTYMQHYSAKTESPPIILNAFFWELVDVFYQYKWMAILN